MQQILPDLWQTRAEHPIPGAPDVATHAYVLTQAERNVLIYSTGHADEHEAMETMGGITHQILSHRDETGPGLVLIRERLGVKLACHRRELDTVRGVAPVDVILEGPESFVAGFKALHTPGHTAGSVCYVCDSPATGKRYLFTGDTVFWNGEGWGAMAFPGEGGGADALIASLTALRPLEPDVVVSSASVGAYPFKILGPGEWRAALDQAARSLRAAA